MRSAPPTLDSWTSDTAPAASPSAPGPDCAPRTAHRPANRPPSRSDSLIPPFPPRPAAPIPGVDVARLPPRHPFHQHGPVDRLRPRVDEPMDVMAHETIGIHLAGQGRFPFLQDLSIVGVVVVGPEDNLLVVAPLDDVVRLVRHHHAPLSRRLRHPAPPPPPRQENTSVPNSIKGL
jgi:hypothetical protein